MTDYFYNNVVLIGRVGSDPEIKYFDSGKAKATFSLAVNRYLSKDNQVTDWFRVEFWERDAETISEYVKKGALLSVEGRVAVNKWNDKASGVENESFYINGTAFRILSSKNQMQAV